MEVTEIIIYSNRLDFKFKDGTIKPASKTSWSATKELIKMIQNKSCPIITVKETGQFNL